MTNPTERTEIYHTYGNALEKQEAIMESWAGSAKNKALIKSFQRSLFAKGVKQYRVAKLTWQMRIIADSVAKDLDNLTKDDAEVFLAEMNRREKLSLHTRRDYIRGFKQFFKWFEDDDGRLNNGDDEGRREALRFYRYIRKISAPIPRQSLDYATIITDEDALHLIKKGAKNALERAIIAVLHETGVRVGELLGMRLRDIERKGQYAIVRVDGKTGERRVPILQSLPWVEQWLKEHPFNEQSDALLWLSTHNRYYGEPLRHYGVLRLLQRTMKRSLIGKRCNPHWFRHSRATINATRYSEQVLCKLMGWELGSKQVRTYVHLGASQVEEAFKMNEGLAVPKEVTKPKAIFCVCGKTNPPESRYCYACGRPLSVGVMLQDEEQKSEATEEAMKDFAKLAQNPEALKAIMAIAKKFEGS